MRIRTIKPEFFTHEGLFDAENQTGLPLRVAYAGLWCAADRRGRFKWEPRRLGVSILPYDGVDFSRVLDACLTRGFIVKYRVGDLWFGAIPSWQKHQIINNRETESSIPDISNAEEVDASVTREARVDHASKGEGKGREGEQEGKGGTESTRREMSSIPQSLKVPEFEAAWSDWLEYSAEAYNYGKPIPIHTADSHLRLCVSMGPLAAVVALRNSISRKLREPSMPFGPSGKPIAPAKPRRVPENVQKVLDEAARVTPIV